MKGVIYLTKVTTNPRRAITPFRVGAPAKIYPRPFRVKMTPQYLVEGRGLVTICIAALCWFDYRIQPDDPEDWGLVAITASDRMITFGDVQYEPSQTKLANLTRHTVALLAGDYDLNSEALKGTQISLRSRPNATPHDVALMYGTTLQAIRRRKAEDVILAPIGMNTDLLMAQQREMSDAIVDRLITQMQEYQGGTASALIVGIQEGHATIYLVDSNGSVSCLDDAGFHAIGSGNWHANSFLMQSRYNKHVGFHWALANVFAAKKAADIAPGVGKFLDMHVIFRSGATRIFDEQKAILEDAYKNYIACRETFAADAEKALRDVDLKLRFPDQKEFHEGQTGKDSNADASADSTAAQASRPDEARQKDDGQEAAK